MYRGLLPLGVYVFWMVIALAHLVSANRIAKAIEKLGPGKPCMVVDCRVEQVQALFPGLDPTDPFGVKE